MAKNKNTPAPNKTAPAQTSEPTVKTCEAFDESVHTHPGYANKIKEFVRFKSVNPTASFGSNDSAMSSASSLGKNKVRHANIANDLRIFYRISGNPTVIYLYGIFSHDESGTGHSSGNKDIKRFAKYLEKQFPELNESLVDEISLLLECELACKKEMI
jgi:hypothetical protein